METLVHYIPIYENSLRIILLVSSHLLLNLSSCLFREVFRKIFIYAFSLPHAQCDLTHTAKCFFLKIVSIYVEIKCQLDATEIFLLQILLFAQHVSGTTMPVIRSSRVLYSGCCLWYFVLWFSSCWSGVELIVMCPVCRMLQHPANRTHNPQLHTRPAT